MDCLLAIIRKNFNPYYQVYQPLWYLLSKDFRPICDPFHSLDPGVSQIGSLHVSGPIQPVSHPPDPPSPRVSVASLSLVYSLPFLWYLFTIVLMTELHSATGDGTTEAYGPLPLNPFKEARESIIDPSTGRSISHHVLARKMGITKLSLIRLEQGTFVEPLPTVMNYFVDLGFNHLSLTDGYENFQYQTRIRNRHYFGENLEFELTSDEHPFAQLRSRAGANPTECAKALCVPQSTLVRFEKEIRQQKSVPKCVINVLPIIGYSDSQISSFLAGYREWRLRALGKNVIVFGAERD